MKFTKRPEQGVGRYELWEYKSGAWVFAGIRYTEIPTLFYAVPPTYVFDRHTGEVVSTNEAMHKVRSPTNERM